MNTSKLFLYTSITFLIGFGVTLWLFNAQRFSERHFAMILRDWYGVKSAVDHCWLSFTNNTFENMTLIENCTVPVYRSTNESNTAAKSEKCVPCNRYLFKKYYSNSSDFLYDGFWNIETANGKNKHFSFQPSICKFSSKPLDSKFIRKCLVERNIKKIITMGDSNGKLTYHALRSVLGPGIKNCSKVRYENTTGNPNWPDFSYYLGTRKYNMTSDIASKLRLCYTCGAELYNCSYEVDRNSALYNDRTLILEHLAMNEVFGNNMRVIRTIEDIIPTNYSQDIIFKYYLKDNYPDVLILSMPCIHEILARNLEGGKSGARLTGLLQQFLNLLKKTVPKSTQIFWIPAHYFFPPHFVKIQLCNKILFETIKDEIAAPNSNMHATLNLFELGCSMRILRRGTDYAHMAHTWYTTIVSHLMEQLCN